MRSSNMIRVSDHCLNFVLCNAKLNYFSYVRWQQKSSAATSVFCFFLIGQSCKCYLLTRDLTLKRQTLTCFFNALKANCEQTLWPSFILAAFVVLFSSCTNTGQVLTVGQKQKLTILLLRLPIPEAGT